jgi:hypothetical protein
MQHISIKLRYEVDRAAFDVSELSTKRGKRGDVMFALRPRPIDDPLNSACTRWIPLLQQVSPYVRAT